MSDGNTDGNEPVIAGSARQTFADLNAKRPEARRLRALGAFKGIVEADVYSQPETPAQSAAGTANPPVTTEAASQ